MSTLIDLSYRDVGQGDETIVFLHGLGACSESWEYQENFFKERYRLIIPDIRGHGKSSVGTDVLSFELCADDIYLLLKKLGIQRIHLCGFSFGGMVAFEFAVKYPGYLISFCAVNVLDRFELNSLGMKLIYPLRRVAARILPISLIVYIMAVNLFPNKKDRYLRAKMIDMGRFVNRNGYTAALDAMKGWSVKDKISMIKVKSLIVGSEFDYKIFDAKKELARHMIEASYIEIKNAHHFVIWEYADEFNRIYNKFLKSL